MLVEDLPFIANLSAFKTGHGGKINLNIPTHSVDTSPNMSAFKTASGASIDNLITIPIYPMEEHYEQHVLARFSRIVANQPEINNLNNTNPAPNMCKDSIKIS